MAGPESYNPERGPGLSGRSRMESNMPDSPEIPTGAQGTEGGANAPANAGRPNVVIASDLTTASESKSRGPFGWFRKQRSHQILVQPGEQTLQRANFAENPDSQPQESAKEVSVNASLGDEERLQTAKDLLKTSLTAEQEQAILKAHTEGVGEVGKDNNQAGVFNYTQEQLRRKTQILKEGGFSREQRRIILEAGIAGVIPKDQFAAFKPDDIKDPKLNLIANDLKAIGEAEIADEVEMAALASRVGQLIDRSEVDPKEARDLLVNIVRFRRIASSMESETGQISSDQLATAVGNTLGPILEALNQQAVELMQQNQVLRQELNILRQQVIIERQADGVESEEDEEIENYPDSEFGNVMRRLADAKVMPARTSEEQDARQAEISEAERLRDEFLEEAKRSNLFDQIKPSLFNAYYDSRVEVTYRDKVNKIRADGRPGVLVTLGRERTRARRGSWEVQTNFWAKRQRQQLEARFGGIVDYFNRESLDLIIDVVKDRYKYINPYKPDERYPVQKIVDIWSYTYEAPNLEPQIAIDFNDVRDIVEEERRLKPDVPNRGDYESWIVLVADSPEEAEELIPQIVGSVRAKLTGSPQEKLSTIQEESRKWPKAIDRLRKELRRKPGDPEFRRLTSILVNEIRLMGIEYFSEMVHETWDPFLQQEADFAREFRDTKDHDHIIDGMYFDKTGIRAAAFELYAANDWEIFRYGVNTKATFDTAQIGDMEARIQATEQGIEDWLVNHELKPIDELLGLSDGSVIHPAFQRIKDKLEELDREDGEIYGYLRDSNDDTENTNPEFNARGHKRTEETRWQEYIRKAREWQRTGKMGDPRDRLQRVLFQHPLARVLWPAGKDAQGNDIPDEFWSMYREIPSDTPKKYRVRKREEVGTLMESVRRGIRATMLDAVASGPRLNFEVQRIGDDTLTSEQGKITQDQQGNYRLEITPTLSVPIDFDGNGKPFINEVIPMLTMEREVMRWIVETDGKKPPKRHMVKLYRVLRDKVGIDLALPSYSAWYWGAHDTNRPHLLTYLRQIPGYAEHVVDREKMRAHDGTEGDDGWGFGADSKTALSRMPEDERRLGLIALIWIKNKFSHKNYPGQDDIVKEFRNILFQEWGISQGTVQINGLIKNAHLGERDLLRAFGCQTLRQFVGLLKGPDEIVFQQTKGFFASPRDAQNWVKRFGAIVEQAELWTGRGGGKEAPGILTGGPISGAYHLRFMNVIIENFSRSANAVDIKQLAYKDPEEAYRTLTEGAYEKYVDIAGKLMGPMMVVMEARKKLENVYGQSPQTAMFLNTLLWYDFIKWMEDRPDEFRQKFGYAYDADLNLARIFMHTVLYESRLIYSDPQWDQIILGYTIHKDRWQQIQESKKREKKQISVKRFIRYKADAEGRTLGYVERWENNQRYFDYDENSNEVVSGEIIEGLLDALPPKMRKDLLDNKWLPVGINSYKPEDLDLLMENLNNSNIRNREIYSELFKVAKKISEPRKKIIRPEV